MSWPSLRIEGALLSAEVLEGLETLPGQRPADFGLDTQVPVKDEIARAWAQAQALWRRFRRRLDALPADSPATRETRQHWVLPLLALLGWRLEFQPQGTVLHGKRYPLSHRETGRAGTVVHLLGWRDPAGLDHRAEATRAGAPRLSAHALVQEYLNLGEELYGVVSNGRVLRLLRDSTRLAQLSYVELDLERLFGDGLFADFALLYRLLHASRLPAQRDAAALCWLERYHQDALEAGSRLRAGLARAVEVALQGLANGFMQHAVNGELRGRLERGELSADGFYKQLLRLIYRLLFLMVIEERGLVFAAGVPAAPRAVYACCYSLQRLRRLSERRHPAGPRHADLWPTLRFTFSLFEADGPGGALGLAPLAGELFAPSALGELAGCTLDNGTLLAALRALSLHAHPDSGRLLRVNYGALNVEELGAVYEGLLEYRPALLWQGARPAFELRRGDERAHTGAHYTPAALVQPLLQYALDPLIAACNQQPDPCAALLALRVVDVACGSGHLLLAAARRIAMALAIRRSGEDQPAPTTYRAALRDAIRRCIHGVDRNPLAVELCKVALWLEAHVPGEPLGFLDHHIKCGNAIVGYARHEDIARRGVPDEAFTRQAGDDHEVLAALRRRNRAARAGQGSLCFQPAVARGLDTALRDWHALEALPEHTPQDVQARRARFIELSQSAAAQAMRQWAALPIAQFYLSKRADTADGLVTADVFEKYGQGEMPMAGPAIEQAWSVANAERFFHWFLEFPEVMAQGGFDCVIGNPPYLGGTYLSAVHGRAFCKYVCWEYAPTGLSDLVVFFLRRMYALLKSRGYLAFITTNSIKDGNIRRDGLEQVMRNGAKIVFAVRGVKWPGRANVMVSLLALRKSADVKFKFLDGKPVSCINAFLEDAKEMPLPRPIAENQKMMFEGSKWVGDGFVLTQAQAMEVARRDPNSRGVILPLLNGEEVNQCPAQTPGRHAIYMSNLSLEQACRYGGAMDWLRLHVKPYRDFHAEPVLRHQWWIFKRPTVELYARLAGLRRCFVATATTKYLNFSALPVSMVFAHTLKVLVTERWDIYAVLQSSLHEAWARKYSGAFMQELRYSSTKGFETFVFPAKLWQSPNKKLAALGERYHEHRRRLMLELGLGLTAIYNLFHAPSLSVDMVAAENKGAPQAASAGFKALLELRRLHELLDVAVCHAYGWRDLALGHGFIEGENRPEHDRMRFSISAAARVEILRRLLDLNLERAENGAPRPGEAPQARAPLIS